MPKSYIKNQEKMLKKCGQFRPSKYMLSELVVSANHNVLQLMDILRRLLARSCQTMPLLVDERLPFASNDACQWYARLRRSRVVGPYSFAFGHLAWYKHTLMVLYRCFFPLFSLLECTG